MIDLLSKRCGLGTGRFKFDRGAAATATQVISEDSDLYQSVKRHEKPLERAIIGMVRALSTLSGGNPDIDVTVEFDDSIRGHRNDHRPEHPARDRWAKIQESRDHGNCGV